MYDEKRKPVKIEVEDEVYIKLAKGTNNSYKLVDNQNKLAFTKLGPYKVVKVVSPLSFEIALPDWLRIHPVISIEHLEPKPIDPYKRKNPEPGPIHIDGQEKYIVEKILAKEIRRKIRERKREPYYLVKCIGYKTNEWIQASTLKEDVPGMVQKFEEGLRTNRRSRH